MRARTWGSFSQGLHILCYEARSREGRYQRVASTSTPILTEVSVKRTLLAASLAMTVAVAVPLLARSAEMAMFNTHRPDR